MVSFLSLSLSLSPPYHLTHTQITYALHDSVVIRNLYITCLSLTPFVYLYLYVCTCICLRLSLSLSFYLGLICLLFFSIRPFLVITFVQINKQLEKNSNYIPKKLMPKKVSLRICICKRRRRRKINIFIDILNTSHILSSTIAVGVGVDEHKMITATRE